MTIEQAPLVLIADDDPISLRLIGAVLAGARADLRCATAPDGVVALELARRLVPDVILLDIEMPGLDGLEVCRRLRADPVFKDMPVLMVTSRGDREARLAGFEAGADDFIAKPFDALELRARVSTVVRLNRFRRILAAQDRFMALFEHSPSGIALLDRSGHVRLANPALCELLALAPDESLDGRLLIDLVPPAESERLQVCIDGALAGDCNAIESELRRPDGGTVSVLIDLARVASPPVDDAADALQLIVRDVTEQRRYHQELERRSNFDALTGLPNRNLLGDRIAQAIMAARRAGARAAVLALGLARFRRVNETLGTAGGDEVLRQVAARLQSLVDGGTTVARLGGDEFVVVPAPSISAAVPAQLAQRLLGAFDTPFRHDGQDVFVRAAVGIALSPDDGSTPTALLGAAEVAMHRAQALHARGGGHWLFHSAEMTREARERSQLEAQLRRAASRGELVLVHQPKVASVDGRIVGAEALLRWQRDDGIVIGPSEFIPVAEDTGVVLELGEWAIHEACRFVRRLHDDGLPLPGIAVNVSARQFREQDLARVCRDAIADAGVSASRLQLELTESMMIEDPARVLDVLGELHGLGVQLAIDDFGTGYSSLQYLRNFPVDYLKIDQSFVNRLPDDAGSAAITRAIIEMAHCLGLEVIAEGVGSAEQHQFLRAEGCEQMQGYFLSRPLEAQALVTLLRGGGPLPSGVAPFLPRPGSGTGGGSGTPLDRMH